MRTALILFAVAVSAAYATDTTKEFQATIRPIAEQCAKTTGATNEDVESIVHLRDNYTSNGRCMVACVMSDLGILRGAKFAPYQEHIEIHQELFANDPYRLKNSEYIVTTCTKRAEDLYPGEACNVAYEAIKCVVETEP